MRPPTEGFRRVAFIVACVAPCSCSDAGDDSADAMTEVEAGKEAGGGRPPSVVETSALAPKSDGTDGSESSGLAPRTPPGSGAEQAQNEPSLEPTEAARPSDAAAGGTASGAGGRGTSEDGFNGGADGASPTAPTQATGGSAGSDPNAAGGSSATVAGSGGAGGSSPEVVAISFSQVEQEVFEPAGCIAGYCHGGGSGDLVWSYEELLLTAAEPVCGLTERVVPGDPEASILWARVRPMASGEACAEMMPKGGPPLDAEQAQLVYDWIASGAAP